MFARPILLVSVLVAGAPVAGAGGVQVRSDVPYLAPGRAERLDLYLPSRGEGAPAAPAVVVIHGGGWVMGDKADPRQRNICQALAKAGYLGASINYRLGDRCWPTNLEDCKNAVRYLRVHAGELDLDPARIAVLGCSAGGHLALMVGFTSGDPGLEPGAPYPGVSSAVSAVVEMYGITDLLTRANVDAGGAPTGGLRDSHAPQALGAARAADPALWRLASPVSHLAPGGPPVLIVHGLADPIVDCGQARELDQALSTLGIPHELVMIPGAGHEFDFTSWHGKPLPRDLAPIVLAFLARRLP